MKRPLRIHFALLTLTATLHAESFLLFNTGLVASGTPLPGNVPDAHWTVISGPGISTPIPALINANQEIGFYAESQSSRWIWVAAGTGATFQSYTFRLTFDLTDFDPLTAVITGRWAVDNAGILLLNGTKTGIGTGVLSLSGDSTTNFVRFHDFTLAKGFRPGINTLDVVATDFGGGAGFNVTELTGTAERSLSIRCSQVEICWSSVTNATYQVQYRSNLTTNIWTPLIECVSGTGTNNCVYDAVTAGQPQRFYRVVLTNCVP